MLYINVNYQVSTPLASDARRSQSQLAIGARGANVNLFLFLQLPGKDDISPAPLRCASARVEVLTLPAECQKILHNRTRQFSVFG